MTAALLGPSRLGVVELADEFDVEPGYLATAATGVLPRKALAAMTADLIRASRGQVSPADYDPVLAAARRSYAAVVGVPESQVATGGQTSQFVANVAAGLPDGAEVLVAADEFSSVVLPFAIGGRLRVRTVRLAELAAAITEATAVVAFSLVQSATGEVADAAAISAAAAEHHALTVVDLTQAAGVLPVCAGDFDVTVCHAYKWLCAPRGVAFLTARPAITERLVPVAPGWCSADDPWLNCYWPRIAPASGVRHLDTAPAWEAFVGGAAALELFARADSAQLWEHASGLADRLCRGLGIAEQHRAIISWPDPDGSALARLTAAGLRASGPLGLVRVAFHVWNTVGDVEAALAALA